MRRGQFTESQIVGILKNAEAGVPVADLCRKFGVSQQTFFRWKRRFNGLGVTEIHRLRQLEEENRKLNQLVADLSLDKQILREVVGKKL